MGALLHAHAHAHAHAHTQKFTQTCMHARSCIQYIAYCTYIEKHRSFTGSYTKCRGNGKVHDECNRRCDCRHGQMVNCKRVRKEFTELTLNERRRFIKAFKTLASDLRYKKKYEKYVKIHSTFFFSGEYSTD